MTDKTVELHCPAKLNMALSVGAANIAHGSMHPIASWMVALNFADKLTLSVANCDKSAFHIRFDEPWPGGQVDWPLERDLAYRAHQLVSNHVHRPLVVNLSITKSIPTGTGLGGGSSNAAGTLVGLNQLFNLNLKQPMLLALAGRLGCDVMFQTAALLGQPSAIVTGFGNELASIPTTTCHILILIFPPLHCPTPKIYQIFDDLTSRTKQSDEYAVRQLAQQYPDNPKALFNDLSESTFTFAPSLRRVQQNLQDQMDRPIYLTGSGSTLFTMADDHVEAVDLSQKITQMTGLKTVITETMVEASTAKQPGF